MQNTEYVKKNTAFFLVLTFLVAACTGGIETAQPTISLPTPTQASPQPGRILLTVDALTN